MSLLEHWHTSEVTLSYARAHWLNSVTDCWLSIANMVHEADRRALCLYLVSGDVLGGGEKGSVTMFSLPDNCAGTRAIDESIFQTIRIQDLVSWRMKKGIADVMHAAVEYFRAGIDRLRKDITGKSLLIDVRFKYVDVRESDTIAALKPYTMSWSNVCDYFTPVEFHKIARRCSAHNTLHFAYTMNWPTCIFGASVLDYLNLRGEQMDEIVKKGSYFVTRWYDKLQLGNVMVSEPIDDPRNLFEVFVQLDLCSKWVYAFFAECTEGSRFDTKRQVNADLAVYSIFARNNGTIYLTFTYDSQTTLKKIKENI